MKDIFLFYFFSFLLLQLSNSYSRKPKDKKTLALGMTAGIDPRSVMEWRRPGGTACVIVVSSAPGRYTRGIRIRDDRRD